MQETVLNGESMNIVEDNIEKLKSIFPDVFTEGKVDFDKLQDVLGNYIEKKDERYNFTWNGKSAALRLAQTPSTGTLRPCREESKNWDTTENLYIEGDNLEVLKLLQKSYHNKIKMIYIDPPYNTGNDFVYKDDFKDNLENYKKITGQIDEDGNKISTNSESDGRYHTNWLNMMYPRLRLARNLLSDDGVIFISIDDNEQTNLKKICDEIFGEENNVGIYLKQSKVGGGSDSKFIVKEHEYCSVYAKNINNTQEMFIKHDTEYLKRYKEEDENGKYFWDTFARPGLKNPIYYDITAPDGTIINNGWIHSKNRFEEEYKNGIVRIIKKDNDNWSVQFKQYLNKDGKKPRSMTMDFGGTIEGKNSIAFLFNNEKIFSYPKPPIFIEKLFDTVKDKDCLVLDFFSGSATTAHAVMQLNSEDNGNRKFICVQLPEITDKKSEAFKAGYKNICEIGKERIRRAGEKIKEEIESKNAQLKLGEEPKKFPDIGFKVFKLDTSNIKKWNGNADTIESEIQRSIFNYEVGRSELDVVYEIMLKCGLDLTYPIEEINVNGKTLYSIGNGAMFVCMDDKITQDIADKIVEIKDANDIVEPVAVFKDNGFTTDSNKTNIKETLRVAGIKDFITV